MMLDRSGSMRGNFGLVVAAAEAFVRRLDPGDKARIGTFAERVQIEPEHFTSDRAEMIRILRASLQPVGPTVLSGLLLWPLSDAPGVVRFYRDWAATAPDELTTALVLRRAPAVDLIPESLHGHPVVGDERYGREHKRHQRLALHARSISFKHPFTGEPLSLETKMPTFFTTLIGQWETIAPVRTN
jgi:hypothetical protein